MPARDPHLSEYSSFLAPTQGAEVVVPSDTVDLATVSRALYVGGAGDISVITGSGGLVKAGANVLTLTGTNIFTRLSCAVFAVRAWLSNGPPVTAVTVSPSMMPYETSAPDWNRHHFMGGAPSETRRSRG